MTVRVPQANQVFRVLLAVAFLAGTAAGQGVHPVSGRRIAPVMGFGGAGWLVRPERMQEERPDKALDLLELKPGMTVADVGAGVGYYAVRIAARVQPGGRVYATDIQPEMLRALRKDAEKRNISNIETVLSTETDPKLPASAMDLILLVDVYHEFGKPQAMLAELRKALKPDGRLVLLEFRAEDPDVPIREEHKMSVSVAKQELEAEGYRLDKVRSELPWQHVLVFRKTE